MPVVIFALAVGTIESLLSQRTLRVMKNITHRLTLLPSSEEREFDATVLASACDKHSSMIIRFHYIDVRVIECIECSKRSTSQL